MSSSNTDKITYFKPTIKATIVASDNEKINQDTILFKVNDKDVSKSIKINKVSDKEFSLIYQPEENLSAGEQKVEISFEDSAKKKVSKSWTFSITQEESITKSKELNIFGYVISRKTITIIVTGIAIVTLAIISPFIISSIWKKDGKLGEDAVFLSNKVVKTTPTETEMFIMSNADREEVRQKVENTPDTSSTETIKEDKWDNFSAPLLEENDENKAEESISQPTETELQQVEQPNTENNGLKDENTLTVENSITQADNTHPDQDMHLEADQNVTTVPKIEVENIAEDTSTSTKTLTPRENQFAEQTETYIPQTSSETFTTPAIDTVVKTVSTPSETQISDEEILQTIPDTPLESVTQPEILEPISQPTDQEILQTIPDMPQPPAVENSQQQAEEPVYQPVQPTESIPPLPEQTIQQQEQTIEEVQQNIQMPTIEQQQLNTTTPDIVEPEAPAPEDLQKIFEQIQKTGD